MNARVTFVDITPVRAHLQTLADAGISMYRVAGAAELPNSITWQILNRNQQRVRSDIAAIILGVTIEQARAHGQKPPAYVDRIELQRILNGGACKVSAVDKPAYVRALHARHWSANRISRTLAMSHTSVTKALAWQDAA